MGKIEATNHFSRRNLYIVCTMEGHMQVDILQLYFTTIIAMHNLSLTPLPDTQPPSSGHHKHF